MDALIVYHEGQEKKILPGLKKILTDYSIVKRNNQKESDYDGKDLVIVVGGDGTFLRASHFNKNTPAIGINPNPDTREGFYSQMDVNNFAVRLKKVLSDGYRVVNLLRLEVEINGKPLKQLVLNEAYVGDAKPYNVFNYEINYRGTREFHRSSGIIIGTPSGSTAWLKSAGGEVMNLEEKRFQFATRELYVGRHTRRYDIRQGILEAPEELDLLCKSPGIVVVDSISPEYEITLGDMIKVKDSGQPLRYVSLI
jgi:NAD kinase